MSLAEKLRLQTPEFQEQFYARLSENEAKRLQFDWTFHGRPKQQAPPDNCRCETNCDGKGWKVWFLNAGRGGGKTRAGAEWVRDKAKNHPGCRIALVAKSTADTRDVMVRGPSGLLSISPPDFMPVYEPTNRLVRWPNGSQALLFSAEEPDQLRGPQFHFAWADELAAWPYADTWTQLELATRLPYSGVRTQIVVTTTPRPTPLVCELMERPNTHVTTFSTFDNAANLTEDYLHTLSRQYAGTRTGLQELYAQILRDTPGALWNGAMLERPGFRIRLGPADFRRLVDTLQRVVVAIDPSVASDLPTSERRMAASERTRDECGIVAAGVAKCDCLVRAGLAREPEMHGFVLSDGSGRMNPEMWGRKAVDTYREMRADRIVAEVNNGGALVESVLRTVDPSVSYRAVWASKGKATRAEPIAALYEQGRVHHVGLFEKLEKELTGWDPMGTSPSPNRLDALVWALTDLQLNAPVAGFERSCGASLLYGEWAAPPIPIDDDDRRGTESTLTGGW